MSTNKNDAKPLIALGLFVLVLVLLLSWNVRRDNIAAGSFRLDEVVLCEDLDDNMNPQERKTQFSGDTKQVCLWFEYAKARDGDQLEVQWQFGKDDIQRESFRLVHARGTRAFYLLREDGSALPPGMYVVSILCNGRTKGVERFEVEPPIEDPTEEEAESLELLSPDLSSDLRKSPDFS
ncbi:hypothetical protein LJC31_01165 [Synergistaceae bacterium OttesenSCG-928-I11]|nr:hypothetical protein [Synergistaceae bacterium OttesenSCG-928-I11]